MMKKIFSALLFVILACSAAFGEMYGYVETAENDPLNLRDKPTVRGSKILAKLNSGTKITIHETVNGWHRVNFEGREGWVSGKYVKLSPIANGRVTALKLNVRDIPTTEKSNVIAQIGEGHSVSIYEENDGWYRIFAETEDGRTVEGWISAKFVALDTGADSQESEINISVEDFARALISNPEQARRNYAGKILVLTGKIDKVVDLKNGNCYLRFNVYGETIGFDGGSSWIECEVSEDDPLLFDVEDNSSVTLQGKVSKIEDSDAELQNCKVISLN